MGDEPPFSTKDAEGIRRVSAFLFAGGTQRSSGWRTIEADVGSKARARFLAYLTDIFLTTIDRERGTIIHLPYPGSILEQPDSTRTAWMIMQNSYFAKLKADLDSETQRMAVKARRR